MRNHTTHFNGDCGCLERRVAALEEKGETQGDQTSLLHAMDVGLKIHARLFDRHHERAEAHAARLAALEKRMDEVLGGAPRVWHDATGDGPHDYGDCGGNPVDGCRFAGAARRQEEKRPAQEAARADASAQATRQDGPCVVSNLPVTECACPMCLTEHPDPVHVSVNTPDPANGPQGWKAREGQGYEHGKGFEKVFWYEAVERHPKAREWWLCVACGRTFEERPSLHWWTFSELDEVCHAHHGWSRVLEIERTP